MTYEPTDSDNYLSANERDVPSVARRYTCDMGASASAKIFTLPVDAKIATIKNGTDKELYFYPALYDGSTYTPASNLHGTGSSRILTVASGADYPLAQNTEFNTLIFISASGAATGNVTVLPGAYGKADGNGHADIETRAVAAT